MPRRVTSRGPTRYVQKQPDKTSLTYGTALVAAAKKSAAHLAKGNSGIRSPGTKVSNRQVLNETRESARAMIEGTIITNKARQKVSRTGGRYKK